MNKEKLRDKFKQIRSNISPDNRVLWDRSICDKIKNMQQYSLANTVAGYYPLKEEVDIITVLEDILNKGKTLVLPVCIYNGTLEFRKVESLSDLKQGVFGLMQPGEDCRVISYDKIDLMLVPGLVFDRKGNRIGYGKGYYDRALANLNNKCATVGIAYNVQIIDNVPSESFDLPVDTVVCN